jgi:hypothetical protein
MAVGFKTFKKRFFEDEELSRILGECDRGNMEFGGGADFGAGNGCCVNQAAYNEPGLGDSYNLNQAAGQAFDGTTEDNIRDPEKLLAILEAAGVA